MGSNWEQLAADKRSSISNSIPSEWMIRDLPKDDNVFSYPKTSGLLSAQELELTESSATELVAQLAEGKLKSVDVTLAFCKRAALAQQLVSSSHATDSAIVSSS
jgi:amidase